MMERLGVLGPHQPEPVTRPDPSYRQRIYLAVLLGLCLATYGGLVRGGSSTTDRFLFQSLRSAAKPDGWTGLFVREQSCPAPFPEGSRYHPLADLTLLLDDALWAGGAAGFRTTNLMLHAGATCGLFLLACRFGLAASTALAAAVLFAVHPVHLPGVAAAEARPQLLAALLSVGAIWLYARAHASRSRRTFAIVLAMAAGALLACETATALVLGIWGVDAFGLSRGRGLRRVVARGLWREGWRGTALRLAPFVAIVLLWVLLLWALPGGARADGVDSSLPARQQALTAGRVLLQAPIALAGGWSGGDAVVVPPVTRPWSPWFLAGLAGAGAVVWAIALLRRKNPAAAFGLIVTLTSLVHASAAAGVDPLSGDRVTLACSALYLPAWGGALALAGAIEGIARRTRRAAPAFTAVVGVLAVLGVARCALASTSWIDEDARVIAAVRAAPEEPRSHVRLGMLRARQGREGDSRRAYEQALALAPRSRAATLALADWNARAGDDSAAARWYERSLALEPRSRAAHLGLAAALRRLGRTEEAAREHALLAALGASDAEVRVDRGELHLATGQLDAARREFEAALRQEPAAGGWVGLGEVHRRCTEMDAAESAFRTAMRLDPGAAAPRRGLGLVLAARRGTRDEARMHLRIYLAAGAGDAEARAALARLEDGGPSGPGRFPAPRPSR